MISVIVYGRNDSHGYNLPRRAALSLNCLSEILSEDDDEIIFVDYNTPDHLPTFIEAIGDTLTEKTRDKLRVIRVRPEHHLETLGKRTHLPVVEPIARNIALRRANSDNRWVLSTNTDMVFVMDDGASLNDIIGDLKSGLYHAPRFEVPEVLWEGLDRGNPHEVIRQLGAWGREFRLDEVVRAGPDAVFDGPGDFQLFPHKDGAAIGGFEEEMIHGWHVDSNLGRRMRLHFGKISEMPPALRGYHCGHTREPTKYHAANAVQNNEMRFVHELRTATAINGANDWGAPNKTFEEFSLKQDAGSIISAVRTALGDTQHLPPLTEAKLQDRSFGTLDYDAPHVLPHLINVAAHESANAAIAYIGCRPDLFQLFVDAWTALPGGERKILTPDSFSWISSDAENVTAVEDVRLIEDGELFIFEFGAFNDATDLEAARAIGAVTFLLNAINNAEQERLAAKKRPRRLIFVNAIHNELEAKVRAAATVSLSPYSTRVRTGFTIPNKRRLEASPTIGDDAHFEIADAALKSLDPAAPQGSSAWRRILPEADALLTAINSENAAERTGRSANDLALIAARLHEERPSRRWVEKLNGKHVAKTPPISKARAVCAEDWNRETWRKIASTYLPQASLEAAQRSDLLWEAVSIIEALDSDISACGQPRILYLCCDAGLTALALANLGALDVLDVAGSGIPEGDSANLRLRLALQGVKHPDRIEFLSDLKSRTQTYDAAVLPAETMRFMGRNKLAGYLRLASDSVKPGGQVILGALARYARVTGRSTVPLGLLSPETGLAHQLELSTPLIPEEKPDFRLTPATLDRIADRVSRPSLGQALVRERYDCVMARVIWTFRRLEQSTPQNWGRIHRRLILGL